jgi:hypothetical protein
MDQQVEISMRTVLLAKTFSISAVLCVACSSPPPAVNSFAEVYAKVIQPNCTSDYCHYAGVGIRYSALDMSSQVVAYWSLVDQPSIGASCSEMGTRVVPFHPENSILYLKVSEEMPPCGSRMPADATTLINMGTSAFSGNPLTSEQLTLIQSWILAGAQNN